MKPPGQDKTVVRFEIAPSTIAWLLATAAGVWPVIQLWVIVLLVVVAMVFVGTLNPVVEWMERRGLGRTLSLALLVIGSLAVYLLRDADADAEVAARQARALGKGATP